MDIASPVKSAFLKARWKNLVFANYIIDPAVLEAYRPAGTEFDLYEGKCFASLVGFMFMDTAIRGIKVPLHTNFEEFNLRFYVRFKQGSEWKRGVVFVREIVPRIMITQVARILYGEKYYYHRMRNSLSQTENKIRVRYEFLFRNNWNHLQVDVKKQGEPLQPLTETAFITEHYWGYTRLKPTVTSEYQVSHPSWDIHEVISHDINIDTAGLYGPGIHEFLSTKPSSVFMAAGSPVTVFNRTLHSF